MILPLELLALYLISRGLTQALYDLIMLATRSRTVAITIISALTFPGTVIHELAHLFTAEVLGVRTGKLTLVPENLQDPEIKAGSVMIAQSDPFRRSAIGCAPLFAGILTISALSYALPMIHNSLFIILFYYLLFAISNSMFSSREDMKGFLPFALTITIMIGTAYWAGLRIGLTGTLLDSATTIIDSLTKSLGIVLALNIAGLLIIKLCTMIASKLTRQKIIYQ